MPEDAVFAFSNKRSKKELYRWSLRDVYTVSNKLNIFCYCGRILKRGGLELCHITIVKAATLPLSAKERWTVAPTAVRRKCGKPYNRRLKNLRRIVSRRNKRTPSKNWEFSCSNGYFDSNRARQVQVYFFFHFPKSSAGRDFLFRCCSLYKNLYCETGWKACFLPVFWLYGFLFVAVWRTILWKTIHAFWGYKHFIY